MQRKNTADVEIAKIIEDKLKSELEDLILPKSTRPQKIFFSRWAVASSEGRQSYFFKVTQDESYKLNPDIETKNKAKIWLYVFPDHREDYLIERIWKHMASINDYSQLSLRIKFMDLTPCFSGKDTNWNIKLPEKFLKCFEGAPITRITKSKINLSQKNEEAVIVKAARVLRYDKNLNKTQSEGIRSAYKEWIENTTLKKPLTNIFQQLYGSGLHPLKNPEESLRFLFMWQNFSIVFPDFQDVSLYFFKSFENTWSRACLGLFWAKPVNHQKKFDNNTVKIPRDIENQINAQSTNTISNLEEDAGEGSSQKDCWEVIKERFEDLWKTSIKGNNDNALIDSLMELAGQIAFSQHEGRPCGFSFIAGTEQIWPAVAEIVSIDFCSQIELQGLGLEGLADPKFEPSLYKRICETNYSIFQVPHVVGVYNTAVQTIYKIIRLRIPSEAESRLLEEPVVDEDDFFCWTIQRIYERSSEVTYIVNTKGDGKVRIYGLDKDKGELLLIWDVGKGKLRPALGEYKEDQGRIEKLVRKHLKVDGDGTRFRKIIKTIRKISANVGEGAALVLANNNVTIKNYFASMELLRPSWLRTLTLDDPHYLLHAAFIMDGACLITGKTGEIKPRQAIYTHHDGKAWGLKNIVGDERFDAEKGNIAEKLSGKGSKTHASANISTLPGINNDIYNPEVVVVSISADGPIAIWPGELLKKDATTVNS